LPHYRDGTPATVGDVVRGRGYNVKDEKGSPAEFTGTVVGITPGSQSCNIQVAHVVTKKLPAGWVYPDHRMFHQACVIGCGSEGGKDGTEKVCATVSLEYGQADQFEKVG
jgi:hypothetical protein